MHIHIIYDTEGWAYHRRALALQGYAPEDVTITFGKYANLTEEARAADLVYLMAYGACGQVRQYIGPKTILVCGYNVGAGYRREHYSILAMHANHVIFNNRDNWDFHHRPANTSWISNGVDRDVFRPVVPIAERQPRVISIGSEYHRRHNDDLKGSEILRAITPTLEGHGIRCDFRTADSMHPPMTAEEMCAWYNSAMVYVVASRCEGTPNPALEAASCGCVLVATRVGNMPELITHGRNGFFVERDGDDIMRGVVAAVGAYPILANRMESAIASWDWKYRAEKYHSLFRRLVEERP